ncbi:hypothetical protein [Kineococcus sp. NPDC059986]|uniref:hypothetical protein n=1 Tax=Kineococcus sp. NPDC059986 TaxID=3155538 RepID=UPI003450F5E7
MFNRLDLHETTLDAFTDLKQFRALSHLVRVLVDLDTKKLAGEKCEGYADVHEVRGIYTGLKGSERMGRLYYRPDLEADRLLVFVHRKKDDKDQREFLEKISKGAVVLGR